MWALAPKVSIREIFIEFFNGGEWPTIGSAVIVGILSPAGAFIGADAAAHLSEEVKNASLTVPRVMFLTVLLNGFMGFVAIVTYVSCIQSVEEQILNSEDAFPFMRVFISKPSTDLDSCNVANLQQMRLAVERVECGRIHCP